MSNLARIIDLLAGVKQEKEYTGFLGEVIDALRKTTKRPRDQVESWIKKLS